MATKPVADITDHMVQTSQMLPVTPAARKFRVAIAAVAANSMTVLRMSADRDAAEKPWALVMPKSRTLPSPKDAPAYQLAHAETPHIAAIAMVAGTAHARLKLKKRM